MIEFENDLRDRLAHVADGAPAPDDLMVAIERRLVEQRRLGLTSCIGLRHRLRHAANVRRVPEWSVGSAG